MSKESTDENREFEEALALQKEENEGVAEEYRRLLEIARSAKRARARSQNGFEAPAGIRLYF